MTDELSYEETQRLNGLAYDEMLRQNGYRPKASKHNGWQASTPSEKDLLVSDYTREQKVAMAAAAHGVEHIPGRRATAPASKTWERKAVPHQPAQPYVPRVTVTQVKGRRSQSVRDQARRTLAKVNTCCYCGAQGVGGKGPDGREWHMDHVVPLSKGGLDATSNMVKSCAQCNMMKGVSLWDPESGTTAGNGRVWHRQNEPDLDPKENGSHPKMTGFAQVQAQLDAMLDEARAEGGVGAQAKAAVEVAKLRLERDALIKERDALAARVAELETTPKRWWHR